MICIIGEGKRRFENLKNWKNERTVLKKAARSGAGSNEMSAAEDALKEYEFLLGSNPYLRLNSTEDNPTQP